MSLPRTSQMASFLYTPNNMPKKTDNSICRKTQNVLYIKQGEVLTPDLYP